MKERSDEEQYIKNLEAHITKSPGNLCITHEMKDKLHEKTSNSREINTLTVAEEAKDLMDILDNMEDSAIKLHQDDFSPRKYVLKRLSRTAYRSDIEQHLCKYYGMTRSAAGQLITSCRKELQKQIKTLTKTIAARNVKYLYDIIDDCMDNKLYDTAVTAIKELNRMGGVTPSPGTPSVTIAKNNQGEELINVTFDQ